jgi:hypothetical protein
MEWGSKVDIWSVATLVSIQSYCKEALLLIRCGTCFKISIYSTPVITRANHQGHVMFPKWSHTLECLRFSMRKATT